MPAAPARATPEALHNLQAARQAYYDKISGYHMAPLWEKLKDLVPREPATKCVPALWRFEEAKALILEAGDLITAKEAERRVLVLENPGLRGQSRITNTLFAGLQMIIPGEVAPAHQHTASAIRFVLDGEGAYTAVEGEKAMMSPGDFVLTPNWAPHDHGNPSKQPMIWLDVLDMPTINFYETGFSEHFETEMQPTGRQDGHSLELFGSGVLPDGAPVHLKRSPVINYTYARTRPLLARMQAAGDIDKRHGARVRYANPLTGGWVLPTMGAHIALLPQNFKGDTYRSTDGTIFVCVEGEGATLIDGVAFEWRQNDVFVIPPWKAYSHRTAKESVLFSISDRPAQEALGIWREGN